MIFSTATLRLFFKYFRNLHFFIWFFLIQLFVFLVLEHWHGFVKITESNPRHNRVYLLYIFGVHLAVLLFVWQRNDAIVSTYFMIFLSFVFWVLLALNRLRANDWGYALLTLTILIQPLEAYHYFMLKASPHIDPYYYDFSVNAALTLQRTTDLSSKNNSTPKDALYYASGDYNSLYQSVSNWAMGMFLHNKFRFVDHLHFVNRQQLDPSELEHLFISGDNGAVVFKNAGMDLKSNSNDPHPRAKAQPVKSESQRFCKSPGFRCQSSAFGGGCPV